MFSFAKHVSKARSGTRVLVDELIELQHQAQALRLGVANDRQPLQAGNLPFALRGHGMEHLETRAMAQGDEVRHIDWRVTARTGRWHVKLFEEERDHPVYFMLDLSESMRFGTRTAFKSVQAARTATLMAWVAQSSGCRVGGVVTNGEQFCHSPALASHTGVLNLITTLSDIDGIGLNANTLNASPFNTAVEVDWFDSALTRLCDIAPAGASIMLFSDFYTMTDKGYQLLAYMAKRFNLSVVFVFDPLERDIPADKSFYVTDGQQRRLINGSDLSFSSDYRQQFEQHLQRIESSCLESGVTFMTLATDQPPVEALVMAQAPSGQHHGGHS